MDVDFASIDLSSLNDVAGPAGVGGGLAHAAVRSEYCACVLFENLPRFGHFASAGAIAFMDRRELHRMNGGLGKETVFDILLDLLAQQIKRGVVLENRG